MPLGRAKPGNCLNSFSASPHLAFWSCHFWQTVENILHTLVLISFCSSRSSPPSIFFFCVALPCVLLAGSFLWHQGYVCVRRCSVCVGVDLWARRKPRCGHWVTQLSRLHTDSQKYFLFLFTFACLRGSTKIPAAQIFLRVCVSPMTIYIAALQPFTELWHV